MKQRRVGATDVHVSEVGFGVWTVSTSWWGHVEHADGVRLLQRALDLGITYFDTADTYANGLGETILADAFRGRRSDVVIGTKFGYDIYGPGATERRGQRELPQKFTPDFVRFAIEQSLRRLETDYIDVYQLHNPRLDAIQRDDLFAELDKLKDEGKIRAHGAALGPAIGGTEHGDEALRTRPMHAMTIIYNMLEQNPGRRFFPLAQQNGTSIMVRVPHSSGLLEGKYTLETTFPPSDHRSHRPRSWLVEGLQKLERLDFLTAGREQTIGQAAIKYILSEPSVCTVLPNIYDAEQLEEFAAAPALPDLSAGDLARVNELYDRDFDLQPVATS